MGFRPHQGLPSLGLGLPVDPLSVRERITHATARARRETLSAQDTLVEAAILAHRVCRGDGHGPVPYGRDRDDALSASAAARSIVIPPVPARGARQGDSESTAACMANVGEGLRAGVLGAIRPLAFLSPSSLLDRIKASSEQRRLYDQALFELGWWLPPSAGMEDFWEVGRLAYERRRFELRQQMVSYASSRVFRRSMERWFQLPVLRR